MNEFNVEMESLERLLWRAGVQYGDDGGFEQVDTAWAMEFPPSDAEE